MKIARLSRGSGPHLYLSGDVIERSDEADEQKKAALFKAGVALSQLSVNHAEVMTSSANSVGALGRLTPGE